MTDFFAGGHCSIGRQFTPRSGIGMQLALQHDLQETGGSDVLHDVKGLTVLSFSVRRLSPVQTITTRSAGRIILRGAGKLAGRKWVSKSELNSHQAPSGAWSLTLGEKNKDA